MQAVYSQSFSLPVSSGQPLGDQSLGEWVDQILASRQLTRRDQRFLLHLTNVSSDERKLLDTLLDRLQRGLIKVVD